MLPIKARYLGFSVMVNAELVRVRETHYPIDRYDHPSAKKSVRWFRRPIGMMVGMITGITTKHDGIIIPGFTNLSGEVESGYLKVTKSHRCYLVRFGAVNRERIIPCDALDTIGREVLPYRTYGVTWDEETRKIMKEDAAKQTRDSRGRFLKSEAK